MSARKKAYYQGVRTAPYDLVREFIIALAVVSLIVIVFSAVLSSPDEKSLTIQGIAQQNPQIYAQTVLDELDGNSDIAGYGPPYNNSNGSVQYIGPTSWNISPQSWLGVHIPVDTAQEYFFKPLTRATVTNSSLKTSLASFSKVDAKTQTAWENNYQTALNKATASGAALKVPSCSCGTLPQLMAAMLQLGQSGAMDGLLLTSGHFYQTDYTRPLLFLQNDAVANQAQTFNLQGSQWGAMNETGNYPGQAWLWLYTLLYQIPPYTTAWAANTDILAVLTITILSLLLLLLPWIPGLNRLPKYLRVYRLIWRDYYREQRSGNHSGPAPEPVASHEVTA